MYLQGTAPEAGLNSEAGLYLEEGLCLVGEESGTGEEMGVFKSETYEKRKDSIVTEFETKHTSFVKFILHSKLYLVALSGIPLGFVREGISLWGPTMLFETFKLNLQSTMGSVLLIPFFNFFGVIAARILITKFVHKEAKLGALFFAGGTITCALLYLSKDLSILVFLLMLAACSMSLYGATSILTSVIPMKYHMTSSIAGFLDFSIYLGAGISGIVSGTLSKEFGWGTMALIWTVAGIAGILCIYLAGMNDSTQKRENIIYSKF